MSFNGSFKAANPLFVTSFICAPHFGRRKCMMRIFFVFIAYPDRVTRAIFKDSVRLTISGGVAIMPRGIEHA
ncbi:hypothetical protein [Paraburkholderia sp. 40]|uniref:hypothetical protein n=1 Tax=unclassified Paraburkholderia TaxID=2615204 RepID=UPI003D19358F